MSKDKDKDKDKDKGQPTTIAVTIALQKALLDDIENYAVAMDRSIKEAMIDLWRFALSTRFQQLGAEELLKRYHLEGLIDPELANPPLPCTYLELQSKYLGSSSAGSEGSSAAITAAEARAAARARARMRAGIKTEAQKVYRCRVCQNEVPPGYNFCPPEPGRESCYFEYNNELGRLLCTVGGLKVPLEIFKGIRLYAELEGLRLALQWEAEWRERNQGRRDPSRSRSCSHSHNHIEREAIEIAMRDLWKFALEIRLPQLGLKTPSRKFQSARYTLEEREQRLQRRRKGDKRG